MFIHDDFLLQNKHAQELYHGYAKMLPIIDYHCHLKAKEIAEDRRFHNMTELWLEGDHYKWRAMRALGIEEKYITGDATDIEKFREWAKVVPHCIGNPLYHWTHLELKRYFGVDDLLNEKTWKFVWDHCNKQLLEEEFSARALILKSNVEWIGTTDDPLDNLVHHKKINEDPSFSVKVIPSFRPDAVIEINDGYFLEYVHKLGEVTGIPIENYKQLLEAIESRVHDFHEIGCQAADHGLESMTYVESDFYEVSTLFQKRRDGFILSHEEEQKYKTFTLHFLGCLYHSLGWIMQLHIGSVRNANKKMFRKIGSNTGYDSINDFFMAKPLNDFLNALDEVDQLPKTIIYTLNPSYNYIVASAIGNFQSEGIQGKIQFGAAWWFNDHQDGIVRHLKDLSNVGILSTFIGMVTDSRSFLSYVRHEYFRRILCNLFGSWIEEGIAPKDYDFLGEIVQNVCYFNAKKYFDH
ncbi:glucuronate isomerase [Anoxybacillus sp. LAT_35]|jgi:glucuronate isomerase|uniref:glucuronate isomerase n=1 Tax=unclassified Anoxybacillus TaxID=2639704 RepID=UPI001EDB0513|nr:MULTISPECIES: glucuronate isomerase [unclassified Anoxybacillus]MCG5024206.1 glucuronate isomerase [Anoxybacillus flavithermus]MCG3086098.1 glucuronate isomerase [Anoxybacillus sp. LAT27]MCG6172892.1 glucuronate isomerase [Anoxybacillus sp. LAT_11]MCG6173522.1 glucuronate isomerase [Anoxybacillus sp. LAT_11]MCG6173916.1 glucuronate isomerase [Anoxybacillus sp. LAT_31]